MDNLVTWFKENGYGCVNKGVTALTNELGIKVKEYDDHGLYVFNYCQIESPKTHPVVMECRGLILDNNFNPVCRPFDRFFNYGEALEITSSFDITKSIVYEKVDGSLVKVWNDGNDWHVGTRGTAFAESTNYTGETFQDLIVKAFGYESIDDLRKILNEEFNPEVTYIFEYTSPDNRVVTPYTEDKMYFLGARDRDGNEIRICESAVEYMKEIGLNVQFPKTYSFTSNEEMREFANNLGGLQEGFVAHDLENNIRIKMKADQYVAVHRLRGESLPTPKRIMGLVVTNETEEYLAYFPEERTRFTPYMDKWVEIGDEIDLVYKEHMNIESQKEFALAIKDYPFAFILFQARAKKEDPLHTLAITDMNKKVKLLSTYMGIE